jgi:hypothetical protein
LVSDDSHLQVVAGERVIVSEGEENLIRAFKSWGFTPIECRFCDVETIGRGGASTALASTSAAASYSRTAETRSPTRRALRQRPLFHFAGLALQ